MRNNVRGEPLGTNGRDKRKMGKREREGDKGERQGKVCDNYEREKGERVEREEGERN